MPEKFFIQGGTPLKGTVRISGSKNAALPILAASLLCEGTSRLRDVPEIDDVRAFLEIMTALGAEVTKSKDAVEVTTQNLHTDRGGFEHPHIKRMRASILFLAPLLIRCSKVRLPFPGGCVLGKRSADSHLRVFEAFGAEVEEAGDHLALTAKNGLHPASFTLPERSVTATENAVMLAAALEGESEIRLAASEPHVQNLCAFLVACGAKINGIGTSTLRVHGRKDLQGAAVTITSDYLEAGTFILAAALTDGNVRVENVEADHLDSFFEKLKAVGVNFSVDQNSKAVEVMPHTADFQATNLQTAVFPGFATDLHPQFAVLLSQCQGTSRIFETLFERKFAYLLELEKMGANVEILNPHQFLIHGPKKLNGTSVASQDIRAGAAMLLAALAAEGETEITNIHYIHRGYERIEAKLKSLGADIKRVSE